MIFSIVRKEFKSMFASPMGWVILALLMCAYGFFYLSGVNNYFEVMSGAIRPAERIGVTQYVGQKVYGLTTMIMLIAVPLLSMRLIAEERRSQTLPFLFSAPLSLTDIVLGKFFGLVAFLGIIILYTAIMLCTLGIWADIDFGYIISNSVGLLLMIGAFSALGLYFSSITSQPVVAAILTFIALMVLIIIDSFLSGDPSGFITQLSVMKHFQSFSQGLLDSADIAYFLLFIITFLVLTIRRLDTDRLRG